MLHQSPNVCARGDIWNMNCENTTWNKISTDEIMKDVYKKRQRFFCYYLICLKIIWCLKIKISYLRQIGIFSKITLNAQYLHTKSTIVRGIWLRYMKSTVLIKPVSLMVYRISTFIVGGLLRWIWHIRAFLIDKRFRWNI